MPTVKIRISDIPDGITNVVFGAIAVVPDCVNILNPSGETIEYPDMSPKNTAGLDKLSLLR
jgi:hypothetical protein